MRNIVNPQQTQLFDPFDGVLTEKARKRLLNGWHGAFRHIILELMPVNAVSEHFDATMGRPTKELYSMAGLLLIKEFKDWTKDEAIDAYCFDMATHYALNLTPVAHDLGERTLDRYIIKFAAALREPQRIEAQNRLGRLRVRGREAVDRAIYLKIAGWNILRASVCAKIRKIVWERANRAILGLNLGNLRAVMTAKITRMTVRSRFWQDQRNLEKLLMLSKAA